VSPRSVCCYFFFSSRRRHTRCYRDWSSDVCSSDLESRVNSTRVVGEAIAGAARPPRVWLQMSTATIYAHRYDAPNDEATGILGEIGRASCRERVEVSEGGVSLTKDRADML